MATSGDPAVFVYGTLLPGELRWPALSPFATDVEAATAPGRLYDTGRGFPAAVFCTATRPGPASSTGGSDTTPAEGTVVVGARVGTSPRRWAELIDLLDRIEAEGTLYRRLEVATSAGPATSYEWLGDPAGLRPLDAGWGSR